MNGPTVSMNKFLPAIMSALCVAILSACGGSGPGPKDHSPVPLPLPVGHGLAPGEITVEAGASEEHGNIVVTCPAGGESCVLTLADDGAASYQRTGGIPSLMPALEPQELPLGHALGPGEITVEAGASEEHGNVVVTCPAGGESCVLTLADDGAASYQRTGGIPSLMPAPVSLRLPAGQGLMVTALNELPALARNNIASRVAAAAGNDVVSSTAATTAIQPGIGGTWNTGITQALAETDNRAINAGYVGADLVFERINFGLGFVHSTRNRPAPPGYLAAIPPKPDAPQWKGAEHFFVRRSGERYYSVYYSDIQDNNDTDYLALGYWAWAPGPRIDRRPFVGAAASGNDPFQAGNITAVSGRAIYEGAATGLYAARGDPATFRNFGAGVRLTADFDEDWIGGLLLDGRDSASGQPLFEELTLENAVIQAGDAAFFGGEVSGVLDGKRAEGRWGGQFYGNGLASTDIPVSYAEPPGSVAGTFGARAVGGDSLLGVFGAYRE